MRQEASTHQEAHYPSGGAGGPSFGLAMLVRAHEAHMALFPKNLLQQVVIGALIILLGCAGVMLF